MANRVQSEVAARLPGAAALGLVLPAGADLVPATCLTEPGWTAQALAARAQSHRTGDLRVLATVWWYSASTVLLAPPLAGLVTGRPLSARPEDTVVALLPGVRPIAAESSAPAVDPSVELRELLGRAIAAVAEAGRMRERPLWAIATDSLANCLLTLGRMRGDVPTVTALAAPLASAIGAPLPVPRYDDVAGSRFVRRASCCLVYRIPGGLLCTSCPRRPPAERTALLERAATGT